MPDARTTAWHPAAKNASPFSALEQKQLRGLYDTSIRRADDGLRALFQRLHQRGALDNTIVVIGSDHGEALGEDGRTVGHGYSHDEILHVPLVMCGPNIPGGVRVRHLTENVDIAPTLCHLAGLPSPTGMEGQCLPITPQALDAWDKEYVFAKNERYDLPPHMTLRTNALKFEFCPERQSGTLLKVPNTVCCRQLSGRKRQASRMEKVLLDDFFARWNEYEKLEKACNDIPISAFSGLEKAHPPELSLLERLGHAERLSDEGFWLLTKGGVLAGFPGKTGLREITLVHPVPRGVYRVYATLVAFPHPGQLRDGRVNARIGAEKTPCSLTFEQGTNLPARKTHAEMGVHSLPDGTLTIHFSMADASSIAAISGVRLLREEGMTSDFDTPETNRENLRALGYF